MNILYLSYDSFMEPLGQSQILPILKGLGAYHHIYLITYDKPEYAKTENEVAAINASLAQSGITWLPLRYHKKPALFSTFFDVITGFFVSIRIILKYKIEAVHARSYVSATIAYYLKKCIPKLVFIFDMRGFWADERVEGKIWPKNILYRIAKNFEKKFLLSANAIITLTHSAQHEIQSFNYMHMKKTLVYLIPTAINLDEFNTHDTIKPRSSPYTDKFVFVYSGSLGTWYELDSILDFFLFSRSLIPNAHLLIITMQGALAKDRIAKRSIPENTVTVVKAPHAEIPQLLQNADVGLAFYTPGYSRKGCSPVKVGEYLACGLPVIINSSIGDMDTIITENRIGAIVSGFHETAYNEALQTIITMLKEKQKTSFRCKQKAQDLFSLSSCIDKYVAVYKHFNQS